MTKIQEILGGESNFVHAAAPPSSVAYDLQSRCQLRERNIPAGKFYLYQAKKHAIMLFTK